MFHSILHDGLLFIPISSWLLVIHNSFIIIPDFANPNIPAFRCLFKNRQTFNQRTISPHERKNDVKIALNCGKKAEKQRKILTFSGNLKNICFTSGSNAERKTFAPLSCSVDYLDFPWAPMVSVAVAFNHFKKFLLAFHRRGQVRFRTRGVNRALTQQKKTDIQSYLLWSSQNYWSTSV